MVHKAQYQLAGEEQIVARFMIEQLKFRGISTAEAAATCLANYDLTRYPEKTGPSFTQFFWPLAWHSGLRLERSAADPWNAFAQAHASAQLPRAIEIQMDYFTRSVETVPGRGAMWSRVTLLLVVGRGCRKRQ